MVNCGAPNCTNRSKKRTKDVGDGRVLTFHKLPSESKHKLLRDTWLVKIKREYIPKEMFICSDHFEADCYERDLKVMLLTFYLLRQIKPSGGSRHAAKFIFAQTIKKSLPIEVSKRTTLLHKFCCISRSATESHCILYFQTDIMYK